MRHIYEKLVNGDPLTDDELEEGIEFFDDLNKQLMMLGPVFRLASTEVNRILRLLCSFKSARIEHGNYNPDQDNDKVEVDRDDLAALLYFKDDSDTFQSAVERVRNAHRDI